MCSMLSCSLTAGISEAMRLLIFRFVFSPLHLLLPGPIETNEILTLNGYRHVPLACFVFLLKLLFSCMCSVCMCAYV